MSCGSQVVFLHFRVSVCGAVEMRRRAGRALQHPWVGLGPEELMESQQSTEASRLGGGFPYGRSSSLRGPMKCRELRTAWS